MLNFLRRIRELKKERDALLADNEQLADKYCIMKKGFEAEQRKRRRLQRKLEASGESYGVIAKALKKEQDRGCNLEKNLHEFKEELLSTCDLLVEEREANGKLKVRIIALKSTDEVKLAELRLIEIKEEIKKHNRTLSSFRLPHTPNQVLIQSTFPSSEP